MREVEPDNKWLDEEGGYDREDREAALKAEYDELKARYDALVANDPVMGLEHYADRQEAREIAGNTEPSESELVVVALLMRLYDVNSAILHALDAGKADKVYEAHQKGEHFNPPIFIPEVETPDA